MNFDYEGLWFTLIELGILAAGTLVTLKLNSFIPLGVALFTMTIIWILK